MLNNLVSILSKTKFYDNFLKIIKEGKREISIGRTSLVHISFMASLIYKKINNDIVIIAPNEIIGEKIVQDVNMMLNKSDFALLFKTRDIIYNNIEASSRIYEYQRLNILHKLCYFESKNRAPKLIVIPIEAIHQYLMSPEFYRSLVLQLKVGQKITINEFSNQLIALGYNKNYQVDGIGQFSIRGEILDIFPPNLNNPVRIDFLDEEIDSIFFFDEKTQRKIKDNIESIYISPTREVILKDKEVFIKELNQLYNLVKNNQVKELIKNDIDKINNNIIPDNIDKYISIIFKEKNTILDYLEDPIIFLTDKNALLKMSDNILWSYYNDIEDLIENNILTKDFGTHILTYEEIKNKFKSHILINSNHFEEFEVINNVTNIVHCYQKEISPWNGNFNLLINDLEYYIRNKYKIIILAGMENSLNILASDLRENGYNVSIGYKNLETGQLVLLTGSLFSGIEYSKDNIVIITINRKYNLQKRNIIKAKKISKTTIVNRLEDLLIGDYVVHAEHGIGIFKGIHQLELDGIIKDYIKIEYADSDNLYVPVTQLDLVSKYAGNIDDKIVKLNKLNSTEWQKKRYSVKKAVKNIAKDLIKIQSERLNVKGYAFSEDSNWQRQFEDGFEYQETEAQLRSIEEIKKDMERPYPMDRLLCGDVGVGKTEVAVRVAFKAVMDHKQVAFLTPTTILSWQHYNTLKSRLNGFPVNVEILSRLRTPKQQKEIIQKLKSGEIEIVIGTHRLLQKDIEFHDLGLVIIDEEQRFGVTDKEKFKKMKRNVDVLTLSATPIPRTLNMAISGIKDMSLIDEMPQNRLPIQTYVVEYDENIIVSAIIKEIKRGGMVFYLHNRVETIDKVANKLNTLIPNLRICIAHGQMLQKDLTKIWEKLLNHEADVLVCTTIIETGIDIPFCNTLIVEDSNRMGLAQLHQLRGRIGRSDKRGFAYMTFPKGKSMSETSLKRLDAIKEFTKFGSGFKIAMRDLEIRGAGDILGAEQHGHIEAVGYDMYIKLLSEAIAEEKGNVPDFWTSEKCIIDLKITAYLPEKYICNLSHRIDIYKKIAMIKTNDDYKDIIDELKDRFGEPPKEVINLLNISFLRNLAIKHNIQEISQRDNDIYFYQTVFDLDWTRKIMAKYKDKVLVNLKDKFIKIKLTKWENCLTVVIKLLEIL